MKQTMPKIQCNALGRARNSLQGKEMKTATGHNLRILQYLTIITINVNEFNFPGKRHRLAERMQK